MKKHGLIAAMCGLILLTGCGRVMSEKELVKYANKNYGKCEELSYETDEDSSEVTLKDKEYGFEYKLWSKMDDINIDGSSFGSLPSNNSTFAWNYLDNFMTKCDAQIKEIEEEYECQIRNCGESGVNFEYSPVFYIETDSDYPDKVTGDLARVFCEYDGRKYFKNYSIRAEENGEPVGEYSLKDNEFKIWEAVVREMVLESTVHIMNLNFDVHVKDVSELEFMYSETMRADDIYGLDTNMLGSVLGNDNDLEHVMVWHYKYKGEEWIVANCFVSPSGNRYVAKLPTE